MTKKLFPWLSFLIVFSFALHSCVHDEISTASDPASKEYHSKSVFKEDEAYIKKIQKVFLEHANLENVKSLYGELYWDYTMSFGQFGEKYALVPVVKNSKVVLLMEAVRKGNRVYFYENTDRNLIDFFNSIIYSRITKHIEEKNVQQESSAKIIAFVCTTRTVEVGCANGETDCTPVVKTQTICEWKESTINNPKTFDPIGMSDGGGDPDGYEYPETPEDPCEKLKTQTTNATFKNNITTLEGKTGDGYESGFRIGTNSDGSLQNQLLQNKPGTQQVDLKAFSNTVTLMHSHYDGLYPIFSPGDIIFFNQWVVWAQNWNSVPTNNPKIPLNNLTFTLVTSNGNYSFNFDGTSTTPLPNYTQQELDDLDRDYKEKYLDDAISIGNVSGNMNFNMEKLEKGFLKFINDKMNMNGLKLYKTTTSGNSALSLVNGTRNETACPN